MVKLTGQFLRQNFKYWKRYVWREMHKEHYRALTLRPLVGWKEIPKHHWNFDEHQPWTKEFQMNNKPWSKKQRLWFEPVKDWMIFKGDRGSSTRFTSQQRCYTRMAQNQKGILFGLGNPLLDITVCTDKSFLEKYDLKANDAILADNKHDAMFEELVSKFTPEYIVGGATQNTIRVAQWLLGYPKATTFMGCVGDDEMAAILREKAGKVGVNVHYQVDKNHPTGVCGAVITGVDRSLTTRLGAANHLSHKFLQDPVNWALVEKAHCYYIGGFVFSVSPKSIEMIADHACKNNKILVMNLSAPFLCEFFQSDKTDIMLHTDILFGNETEMALFCKLEGIEASSLSEMAAKISLLPKKNTARPRTVVITQGSDPTIIGQAGQVSKYEIIKMPKEKIKDTNGCGDAFVGGFLSQLVHNKPISECVRCGNYAASIIIQHYGCTYPEKPDFK